MNLQSLSLFLALFCEVRETKKYKQYTYLTTFVLDKTDTVPFRNLVYISYKCVKN